MNTQTQEKPQLLQRLRDQLQETQEQVAKKAYEKWGKRGYQHGQDQQDWIEAEKEVETMGSVPRRG